MSQSFGSKFKLTFAGESHGPGYTVIIEGYPSNLPISAEKIHADLIKRRPGQNSLTTQRKENDVPQILSGVFEGKSTGAPITLFIPNSDAQSKDYEHLKNLARPGHADLVLQNKFHHRDHRGGGWSSARMTVTWVAAGSLALTLLKEKGISIYSYTQTIGDIEASYLSYQDFSTVQWDDELYTFQGPHVDQMKAKILLEKKSQDSIGGQCRVVALGVPKNRGSLFAESLKSKIAQYFFAGPAITALEFGSGIKAANMRGSEHNDTLDEQGQFRSNHHGGIQAGISTGNPIDLLVTLKAPSSISREQNIFDYQNKKIEKVEIQGRHDPCVVPRYCAVGKSLLALALADIILE